MSVIDLQNKTLRENIKKKLVRKGVHVFFIDTATDAVTGRKAMLVFLRDSSDALARRRITFTDSILGTDAAIYTQESPGRFEPYRKILPLTLP